MVKEENKTIQVKKSIWKKLIKYKTDLEAEDYNEILEFFFFMVQKLNLMEELKDVRDALRGKQVSVKPIGKMIGKHHIPKRHLLLVGERTKS
jgi:hypothetical protein